MGGLVFFLCGVGRGGGDKLGAMNQSQSTTLMAWLDHLTGAPFDEQGPRCIVTMAAGGRDQSLPRSPCRPSTPDWPLGLAGSGGGGGVRGWRGELGDDCLQVGSVPIFFANFLNCFPQEVDVVVRIVPNIVLGSLDGKVLFQLS